MVCRERKLLISCAVLELMKGKRNVQREVRDALENIEYTTEE